MAFQEFTGREYLKIDIANNFGQDLDKANWNTRLTWFEMNQHQLHELVPQAEEPALFYAGILAWEKAEAGKPCGYPISLDATSSGIQILAALCCDRSAAEICNVVDTGAREDAYNSLYGTMVAKLGDTAKIDRKLTKQAIMTSFYNSTAVPKSVFGEGELLNVFYETLRKEAPGAWEINETMLAIWDPTAYSNEWVLPDNFHVIVKVMGQIRENVQFLNEPFEVSYSVNKPIEGGRSLGANMVHSLDGMVVREMLRRCNHDPKKVEQFKHLVHVGGGGQNTRREQDQMVKLLWDHYRRTGFLSARILDYLDIDNFGLIKHKTIGRLLDSLPKEPFEMIAIHDCFRCLPNHGNDLRRQYNNLLAEIAESELLGDIVSQIVGRPVLAGKLDPTLPRDIRESNYALS